MTDSEQKGMTARDDHRATIMSVQSENRQTRKLVEDLLGIQEREIAVRQKLLDHFKTIEGRLDSQANAQLSAEEITELVQACVREEVGKALAAVRTQTSRPPDKPKQRSRVWLVAACIAVLSLVATTGYFAAPLPMLSDLKQRFLAEEAVE